MAVAQRDTTPREAVEHTCPLPHIPGAVSVVRRRVHHVLTGWNLSPDLVQDALLVISELLTNAVVHALPPTALRLSFSQTQAPSALRIEVTDAGPLVPTGMPAAELEPEEHGRGIGIIAALSARCGMHVHSGGTTRWAELPTA